jgi:Fe-S-cluster containining protein
MSGDKENAVLFECRQCGDCCHGYGGTYVTAEEVAAISTYIGTDPADFVKSYCQMSGHRPVLAQAADGYCVFCKDGACRIHPVKPRMCRAWPYLDSILVDVSNWHAMARACPGMRTDLDDEVVRESVRRKLENV